MMAAADLAALDAAVEGALARGDDRALNVLGCGEMSVVLGWPRDRPRFALKRLPVFAEASQYEAYRAVFTRYVAELTAAGVAVVDTHLARVERADGTVAAYCIQPALPGDALAHRRLAREKTGSSLPSDIIENAWRAMGERRGIDAQVANWAFEDGRLVYLDVTTPLLAREDGSSAIEPGVFLAAYPWLVRSAIRRFVFPAVWRRYLSARSMLRDVCANLFKERLGRWLPAFLDAANARLAEPLTEEEIRRDYARDAQTWAWMLRLRRADRWWQRRVRRRPYPFLLPRCIER